MQVKQVEARLRRRGRRMTAQRRAVLQALADLGCALDAEAIHTEARRIHPGLGLVTVYRTLEAFVQDALAQQVHFGDGRVRYELTEEGRHHHHAVCLGCGVVARLDECVIPQTAGIAVQNFTVTAHRVELFGYCTRCGIPR
jgi:Fur family ferric uptake transcriptional regulator